MDKLKTVMMPDGNAFDEHDWRVYSKQFKAKPVTITALKLECE